MKLNVDKNIKDVRDMKATDHERKAIGDDMKGAVWL